MRPDWSSHPEDDGTLTLAQSGVQAVEIAADAVPIEIAAETVPEECPGVILEQPLERWSPRDLLPGLFRLARWSRLATS